MKLQQSLQDNIILQNIKKESSKFKQLSPDKKHSFVDDTKKFFSFFVYAIIIWLALRVLTDKVGIPSFTYIDTIKFCAAALVIKKIFN